MFNFAKSEGASLKASRSGGLFLSEPLERVRELQDDEAAALDVPCVTIIVPFFEFVRASGLRQEECITLKWPR